MAIPSLQQGIPVSLTTNTSTRPVSVRTAQENEIDQINNTPNAKKLYNAKLIGGAIGVAIPLTAAVISLAKGRSNLKAKKGGIAFLQFLVAPVALYFTVAAAKAGSAVSKALTIFFNTRGQSPVEKN